MPSPERRARTPIAHRKTPDLREINAQVLDPRALHSRYFVTECGAECD